MTGRFLFDHSPDAKRTRLLVSVAHPSEVGPAIEGGADIIDVKDPSAGAIGRAAPSRLTEIVARVDGRLPITAAWGELAEVDSLDEEHREALRGVGLVKFGTALFQMDQAGWRQRWNAIRESLPADMAISLVHYADGNRAESLQLEETIALSEEMQACALVVDTHTKGSTSLLDFYSPQDLRGLVQKVRSRGMEVVLAGSLRVHHLAVVSTCGAAIIGVRGAACRDGERGGTVCREQVANLKRALDGSFHQLQTVAPGSSAND